MNRNTEMHFSEIPKIHQNRSKFDLSHSNKLTFNTGEVIPIYVDMDILPGDTVQMDTAELVRMATPIHPVMDNMVMDLYWFFVPHRLVWDHWRAFWGENDDPWTQTTEYEVPQIKAPTGGWEEGTIADYMGIPTNVENLEVSALAFRAYAKVMNDWFRDENLKTATHIYTDETTRTGTNGKNYVTDTELGGKPYKAAKMHDYFTSALPSPQKGPAVSIPLGTSAVVHTSAEITNKNSAPLRMTTTNGQVLNANSHPVFLSTSNPNDTGFLQATTNGTNDSGTKLNIAPTNLYADLGNATAATINQLRTAFAIQKYYEQAGRNGTRYIEYLRSVFGVESSDARIQRSEYLGGKRIPINMEQVLQTSATDTTSPQGNTAGFSCTSDSDNMFIKSFEEHGTLLGLVVCRTKHTYQQGLNKMWTRKKWTDFYNPYFANLGEQAILNEQIYAQGTVEDKEAFGYQEAWAEYRYKENRVCGHMRSNSKTGSLDSWHYADDYEQLPRLSEEWIDEPTTNVDRTIAVSSQLANQFIGDFYFKTAYTRCMPVYSIPGLIDHV